MDRMFSLHQLWTEYYKSIQPHLTPPERQQYSTTLSTIYSGLTLGDFSSPQRLHLPLLSSMGLDNQRMLKFSQSLKSTTKSVQLRSIRLVSSLSCELAQSSWEIPVSP